MKKVQDFLTTSRRVIRWLLPVLMAVAISTSAMAQVKPLTGTVTSADGEPLPGVSVIPEGSKTGTATDIDGKFNIRVPDGTEYLKFSYVGFKPLRVKVTDKSNIDVVMAEDNNILDEVVAIGYGSQRRRNILGAVENVKGEEIENRPNGYITRSLQGMVPGLNIQMADGKPTRSASFQIRATTQSIGAGGAALCLVDGVEADLTTLNPEDVESISVLKDASSAAVYGARGAFGVVLVTTKNAKKGKTQVDYSGSVSFISETKRPELVTDALTWYNSFQEAYFNAFHQRATTINNKFPISSAWEAEFLRRRTDPYNSYTDWAVNDDGTYNYYGEGTNWYDLMYKKHTTGTVHNLRVSGGSDVASYIVSARYFEQDGIFRVGDEKFRQVNVRGKGTVQITPRLKIENATDFVRRTYKQPLSGHNGMLIRRNLEHQGFPMAIPKNPDGTWTYAGIYTGYAAMAEDASWRKNSKFDMKNSTFITYDILPQILVARGDFSYLYNHSTQTDKWNGLEGVKSPIASEVWPTNNILGTTQTQRQYYSGNVNLTWTPDFGDDHNLNVIGGWQIEHQSNRATYIVRDDFILNDKPNYSLMTGVNYQIRDSNSLDWGFVGWFGRASYDYQGKYLAEVSARYDGSSKFPKSQRWGFFPSASVGWRMSQEKFMQPLRFLNNLKWRFSIGKAGNGNVAPYRYMELMSFAKSSVIIDGQQRTMTHVPSNKIPENLTWETSSTINLGLDINMLNNRLNFVGDIYRKATTDMFVVGAELPAVAGYAAPYGNNADMVTKGIELALGWQDSFQLFGKPFSYNIRLSYWDSLSKITKYTAKTNTLPTIYSNSYYEGMTIGEIWGYHVLGLFQTQEEALEWGAVKQKKTFWSGDGGSWDAGDIKFADLDDSGIVDNGSNTLENHGDLKKIGNSTPRHNYGINASVNWNGIGVSVFFQGVGHRDWYPTAESGLFWGHYNRAYGYCLPWQVEDHWSPENPDAYWPLPKSALALSNPRGAARAANDRYLQNAAYCRLKTLTIDYTFNQKLLRNTPITKLRVYVSGENLFYWSPLKKHARNIDPEMITHGDADFGQTTAGTNGDSYGYPMTKSVSVGLNVSF